MKTTRVVTAFIRQRGKVLVLRRSPKVGSYRGCWAAVSGHMEQVSAFEQALIELGEETGLVADQLELRSCGPKIEAVDDSLQRCWQIQMFIFELVDDSAEIVLDWEHEEYQWLPVEQLAELDTVPLLYEAYQQCHEAERNFEQAVVQLQYDREHGAGHLARQALAVLGESAEQSCDCDDEALQLLMQQRCNRLRQIRPSMAVIDGLLRHWHRAVENLSNGAQPLANVMAEQAQRLSDESQQAATDCASHAAALILPGQTIITHSHSSTLMAVFAQLKDKKVKVIVSESRPLNEGIAVARQLQQWGIDVTLITDAQLGLFSSRADVALVGADSVLADGSVVNKAGTSLLALASRQANIPFYAVAESFKHSDLTPDEVTLEQMAAAELQHDFPARQIANIYFDITPPTLLTAVVDEQGLVGGR